MNSDSALPDYFRGATWRNKGFFHSRDIVVQVEAQIVGVENELVPIMVKFIPDLFVQFASMDEA